MVKDFTTQKSYVNSCLRRTFSLRLSIVVIGVSWLLQTCIDPYYPPVQTNLGYLVIDGFLNNGSDSTIITLTRTQTLDAESAPAPVLGATVQVQDEQRNVFTLKDHKKAGKYSLYGIDLPIDRKYRLYVQTGGKEYVSDYVPVAITPPIDSIFWDLQTIFGVDGVQFYVTTHDFESRTNYYRWEYTETWSYHANMESEILLIGHRPHPRPASLQIYNCWSTVVSPDVKLKNTTALSEDIVDRFPLNFAKRTSFRFSERYSLLVNQYALTKDEYLYWQQVKKNSENIGGIFGPIPSQTTGNYTCVTNSAEPVVGYFSFTNKQSKRVFVSPYQLPFVLRYDEAIDSCKVQYCGSSPLDFDKFFYLTFLGGAFDDNGEPKGTFSFTEPFCADCRLLGGKTTKPDFW